MFSDKEEYKEYLKRQQVEISDLENDNYFEHSTSGEIILRKQDYKISAINVENYTNCLNWILLKDKKTMALLKRPFGDIYRSLTKQQYYISLYNNILLPQIAKQLQNKSAIYYIVEGARNTKQILTIDFKDKDEELIHGEEILEAVNGDINELEIQKIVNCIEKYLLENDAKSQDIDTIKKEFIKQSLFNRFVKQSDENNHNWGILINKKENRARIAPIYDLDCCCDIGTLRKHVRKTSDGSQYDFKAFFKEFGNNKWFENYAKEIIEDFNINKAINDAKLETKIEIPLEIKEHYKNFFGERFYELKSAYKQYLENNLNQENSYIEKKKNKTR